MTVRILEGDCLEVMPRLLAEGIKVDSIVTDPPYHLTSIVKRFGKTSRDDDTKTSERSRQKADGYARLATGFMGKKWDGGDIAFRPEVWELAFQILKPGGHMLVFGGTRTYHRMACAVEDAGFEIRDQVGWLFGSGFPKSHDVSKGIAKRAGGALVAKKAVEFMRNRREELGLTRIELERRIFGRSDGNIRNWEDGISIPTPGLWPKIRAALDLESTPFDADMERGDVVIDREPGDFGYQKHGERWTQDRDIREPTSDLANRWNGWGTALKPAWEPIVLARKPLSEKTIAANVLEHGTGALNIDGCRVPISDEDDIHAKNPHTEGGFGHAGAAVYGDSDGAPSYSPDKGRWPANVIHDGSEQVLEAFPETGKSAGGRIGNASGAYSGIGETGFTTEHQKGDPGFGDTGTAARFFYAAKADAADRCGSNHPTVKPIDLIAYLCRLITPPGGTVLDPFAGSGTTAMACIREGFDCILIEREAEYIADIHRRIKHVAGADTPLFADAGMFAEAGT